VIAGQLDVLVVDVHRTATALVARSDLGKRLTFMSAVTVRCSALACRVMSLLML